jgi:hypothetical protein
MTACNTSLAKKRVLRLNENVILHITLSVLKSASLPSSKMFTLIL